MQGQPNAKAIVPPGSTSLLRRVAIIAVIMALINMIIFELSRKTNSPIFDFLQLLTPGGSAQEIARNTDSVPLRSVGVVFTLFVWGELIDKLFAKKADFFLFSKRSPALAPLALEPKQADSDATISGNGQEWDEIHKWLNKDAEKKMWGQWWRNREKVADSSFSSMKFSGTSVADRVAIAWAAVDYVSQADPAQAASIARVSEMPRPGRWPGAPTLWRVASMWRPLKDRHLTWDVGSIEEEGEDTPPAMRLAEWRPRRPTLIVMSGQDRARQTHVREVLMANREVYFYPVRLLILLSPEYPDVLRALSAGTGSVTYRLQEFSGRQWFTRHIRAQIDAFGSRGGIIMLEAPPGWGKTALALNWVKTTGSWFEAQKAAGKATWKEASHAPPPPDNPLLLDGWAFARMYAAATEVDAYIYLSRDVTTVTRQLDACARARLGMPRASGEIPNAQQMLSQLLMACSERGRERHHPVVLLLDGIDELELPDDHLIEQIANFLPQPWPPNVVLILLVRTLDDQNRQNLPRLQGPAFYRLDVRMDARSRNQNGTQNAAQEANEEDIRLYIDQRLDSLEKTYRLGLEDQTFKDALWNASEGYFIVVSGLLSVDNDVKVEDQQKELRDRLKMWRDDPERYLPKGPQPFFKNLIERKNAYLVHRFEQVPWNAESVLHRVQPQLLGDGLLGLIASRDGTQKAAEFLTMLDVMRGACRSGTEYARNAWKDLWSMDPDFGPTDQQFYEGLNALHGLFSNDEGSREHARHRRVRDTRLSMPT